MGASLHLKVEPAAWPNHDFTQSTTQLQKERARLEDLFMGESQDALPETEIATQLERIRVAEDAISQRRRELVSRRDFCSEVYAAAEALMRLWVVAGNALS